jgi:hypothetical protein
MITFKLITLFRYFLKNVTCPKESEACKYTATLKYAVQASQLEEKYNGRQQ